LLNAHAWSQGQLTRARHGARYGYGKGSPGRADMRIAAHAIGQRYDCLAVTLELPFKDTAGAPEPVQGWSAERSLRFGAAALGAVLEVLPHLR
jgi:murein tripeptide amidase MpaA